METVVGPQLITRAVYQLIFSTSAPDIIQEDRTTTLAKVSTGGREGGREREREKERNDI